MKERKTLLIIDPQNDFVDSSGSLYIKTAEDKIKNLCELIRNGDWDSIVITQDSHYSYHIGHSIWWEQTPRDFTKITLDDIIEKKYTPAFPDRVLINLENYFSSIPGCCHTIWPEHCIIGSWGWAFPKDLIEALNLWSLRNKGRKYNILQKGTDPDHEMFSAFSFCDDWKNNMLIPEAHRLTMLSDKIYITGFAKDVCVSWTVEDLLKQKNIEGKLIFVDSCMACINTESPRLEIYNKAIKNYKAVWME